MKSLMPVKILVLFLFFSLNSAVVTAQNSEEKAKVIANKVVEAMGGIDNYNNTKFLKWDFGKRILYWNKWTGDVRIESPKDALTILVNINTLKGKAFKGNTQITEIDKLKKLLKKGKNWWINDSYWLVMPWKLQDPGVNLSFVKTETLADGNTTDVLQLTFNDVGVTPENKYYVYVDRKDHLIKQWAFFKSFNDEEPKFTMLWDNYQEAGDILLSFNRSVFGPKNVVVKQDFNKKLFTDLKYE